MRESRSLTLQRQTLPGRTQTPSPSLLSLRPQPGEAVRLEVRMPRARYSVRLIGVSEEALWVSAPKSPRVVLTEGALLTARMIAGNRICAFSTRLLKAQTHPVAYWVLAMPQQLELTRLREHTRVPVNLTVTLEPDDSDTAAGFSALCVDLCLRGAAIETPLQAATLEQRLFMTARVSVAGIDHIILAPARVCSVTPIEQGGYRYFRYGLEFFDLEEDTRLVLAGFVYQQWLFECGQLEKEEKA